MIWVLAFFAALLCAVLASEAEALFGAVAGFSLVAALGLIHRQSRRIEGLADEIGHLHDELAKVGSKRDPGVVDPFSATPQAEPVAPAPDLDDAVPPPIPELTPARAVFETGVDPRATTAERAAGGPRAASPGATTPDEPGAMGWALDRVRAFFFEGNVPVKLGLLVSLFGVGALIRYASSAGWLTVPVSVRYAAIALAAIGMLVYGLKQVRERPVFGLSLQGGAIGILLLVVFGSYRVPGLLPAGLAFALVLGLVTGAALLAIRQNAVWLAAIGFLGGYLAPILLSTGSGNHVALFSYYALLNGAIFGMAWVRPWRALNLMGFVFTFGVAALWGAKYFRPELFATTEPFLVLFFLMYVTIPVFYALKGREPGKVDATLLFGTPLIAFPMQVALLEGEAMPLAFSALAVAAVYLLLALWSRREERLRVLGQSAAALGLAFATLAVPLALSARWTSATWALQGVALLWLGQTQGRRWPQLVGVGLQLLAGVAYAASFEGGHDERMLLNPHTLNLLLLVVGAGACAWLLDRKHDAKRSPGGALLWTVASAWWIWAGAREVGQNLMRSGIDLGPAWLLFIAASCVIATLLRRFMDWRKPAWWPAVLLPTAVLAVALAFLEERHWLVEAQGLALPALAAALALVLPFLRGLNGRLATAHIAGLAALCLAVGLAIREGLDSMNVERLGDGWDWILPWLPLSILTVLLVRRPRWAAWPVGDDIDAYRRVALGLALVVLAGVWLVTQAAVGSAAPLPWVPLLNPVELFQLAGVFGLWAWVRAGAGVGAMRTVGPLLLGSASFTLLSVVTLRACWHWDVAGQAWSVWGAAADWGRVWSWPQAQAGLSVVWSMAGVVSWVVGSRRCSRPLWTFGALLLGAVLLKLLLVDRSNLGDLLGIVSFLTVGGLLVLVGRLAPRPPSPASETA